VQIKVELRREGEPTRQLTLGPGVTLIGRAPDNDVVLQDVGVSRRHARLVVRQGGAVLEDLGSGNGTFVAGERVRRHAIQHGDDIVIDPFVLHFQLQGAPGTGIGEDETALVDPTAQGLVQGGPRGARLVVLQGHGLADQYALGPAGISLGRSEEREIVLKDPAASRLQAELRLRDDVFWIHDFGSANGTFVNGRRIRERPLQHGDRIRIGSTEFRFELEDVAAGPRASTLAPVSDDAVGDPAPPPAAPLAAAAPPSGPTPVPATAPAAPVPAGLAPDAAVPAAQAAPVAPAARRSKRGLGLAIGLLVAMVLMVAGVAALGLGYVGWRAWTSRQATVATEAAIADSTEADADAASDAGPAAADTADQGGVAPRSTTASPPDERTDSPTESSAAATTADGVQVLMDRGMQLFREESYLEATALFYKALKRDPTNVEAERMCYIACEFLAIQQLRTDLRDRELTSEEREQLYKDAVILARRAMRGAADVDTAESAIIAALEWYPGDDNLLDLQRSVQAQRARGRRSARSSASNSSSMPSGNARLAQQYLDEGLQAISDGRYVTARDRLKRALQMDPMLTDAKARLTEVDAILGERAETAWSQGQQLEAQGDAEGAVAAYQQVVSYAGVSQAQLKRDAQQRIAALGG